MGVGKTKRFLFGGGTYEKKITYFTGKVHCKRHEDSGYDRAQKGLLSGKYPSRL